MIVTVVRLTIVVVVIVTSHVLTNMTMVLTKAGTVVVTSKHKG